MTTSEAQKAPELTLRPAQPADAESLGTICYSAFRSIAEKHDFPPDFPSEESAIGLISMLISRPDVYSVVAVRRADELAGSNFLWESDSVAGVGPITVDVRAQNSSVGRALMEEVIRRSDEQRHASVRLVQAAFHSRSLSLYTKLGFDTVEPLSNMQGPALNMKFDGYAVRPMRADDLAAADALCFSIHGHTRHNETRAAIEAGTALIVEHGGRLTGYTTGVGFFGHSVGESNRDLQALIGASESFPGPGFLLPTRNSELMRWCLENGLRIVQPLTLMSRGLYQEPRGAFLPSILY